MRIMDSLLARFFLIYLICSLAVLFFLGKSIPDILHDFLVITALISFFAIPIIGIYVHRLAGSSVDDGSIEQKRLVKRTRFITRVVALVIILLVILWLFGSNYL